LVGALAHLEAYIDFPDEDLPDRIEAGMNHEILRVVKEITEHLADNRRGERLRDGLYIAVLGPPSVGKSSLINRLARRDAAIVSAQAGTTRDVIEVHLDLGGYPVIVADTAGLHAAGDEIEREGVRRALARADDADLKILVLDGANVGIPDTGTCALIDDRTVVVRNKIDLVGADAPVLTVAGVGAVDISAKTGTGIADLLEIVTSRVEARLSAPADAPPLTRQRHRAALETCREALLRAGDTTAPELKAEDVRLAVRAIGTITGRVDVEDILDLVFRDFCIGK
ncbi:MAG: tRNA modification GTPase, partial [Alphaproteobacteria bacterium]